MTVAMLAVSATVSMSMPEISLLFFLALFIGLVLWLALSRSKRWDRIARIPLDEQPDDASSTGGSDHAD